MIVTPTEYRKNLRKILSKSDYAVVTAWGQPDKVCMNFDESLKKFLETCKKAHAEATSIIIK